MPTPSSEADVGAPHRRSVAILGGGMGALTTAFELSEGNWTERFDRITVYQRGWRLGGKGASSRGPHGRIEEHGLHVLLGYYDHTFDVMRRCYEELDRSNSDPHCPIRSLDDAVAPSQLAGVVDRHDGHWAPWVASFGATPGRPGVCPRTGAAHALGCCGSRDPLPPAAPGLLRLAPESSLRCRRVRPTLDLADRHAPPRQRRTRRWRRSCRARASSASHFRSAGRSDLSKLAQNGPFGRDLEQVLPAIVEPLRVGLRQSVLARAESRRTYALIELVTTNLVGIAADGLLTRPEGFAAIDHLDYRDMAGRARYRPGGPRIPDPAGHVRPGVRVRGRRPRPTPVQRRARASSWPRRC